MIAQTETCSGWSPGWASPSPTRRVMGIISFVEIESGRARTARRLWLALRRIIRCPILSQWTTTHHLRPQVATKTFVDNICKQVIERHLLRILPDIFCRERVASFSDKELEKIAAEQPGSIERRRQLHCRSSKRTCTTVYVPSRGEVQRAGLKFRLGASTKNQAKSLSLEHWGNGEGLLVGFMSCGSALLCHDY